MQVSHCFPLSFADNPELPGIDGVLKAYNNALDKVVLHGPTNFAEFLGIAQTIATQYDATGGRQFLILLIVTDGEITDMDQTVKRIVDMSSLPCAIVIVGVGGADFKSMDVLDADDKPLESNGKRMTADIVQFVPFRRFRNDTAALAREVLQEVPAQLVDYMKRRGVVPAVPQIRQMGTGQYAQVKMQKRCGGRKF